MGPRQEPPLRIAGTGESLAGGLVALPHPPRAYDEVTRSLPQPPIRPGSLKPQVEAR